MASSSDGSDGSGALEQAARAMAASAATRIRIIGAGSACGRAKSMEGCRPRETAMATAALSANDLTAEDILANARAMAPAIAARSEEIEALRRLPTNLVAELRAAGFFRMGRSRAKGGPQMTLPQHLEVIEVLAHADPSVGWCVKIGTDSGLIAEFLPPEASARLLPEPDMITAGQFTTAHGKLEKVQGGYLLTGRFPFGSGVTHRSEERRVGKG